MLLIGWRYEYRMARVRIETVSSKKLLRIGFAVLHALEAMEGIFQELAINAEQVGHDPHEDHEEAEDHEDGAKDERLEMTGQGLAINESQPTKADVRDRADEEDDNPADEEDAEGFVHGVAADDGDAAFTHVLEDISEEP